MEGSHCLHCLHGNKTWHQVLESGLVKALIMPSNFEPIGRARSLNGQWWNIYRVCVYVFGISRDSYGRVVFGDIPQPIAAEPAMVYS